MACLFVLPLTSRGSSSTGENSSAHQFGAIADCQYCDIQGTGIRKYSLSPDKLRNCVATYNTLDLDYVVHLGDFIDRDFKSFDVVTPIFNQLTMPTYHVLGNHDFEVADAFKKDIPKKLGLDSKYYDFQVKGWRYVVLDGNDISFHAYPTNSQERAEATAYYEQKSITSPKWNGAVGAKQLSWLRGVLEKATQRNEHAMIFCHFPVYPENNHNLWNAEELTALLEGFSCVKAYINGHNHHGNYGIKNGIHYLTLKGMVDTEQTSYAVVSVGEDSIHITGYGREEDRDMVIRKKVDP
jgi:predicted phosphodiesterase